MTLKVKVNDLHFQYQLRVFYDACLVKITWFQLQSVMSFLADMAKFKKRTDRQTEGQTDAGKDNTPLACGV